MAIRSMSTNKWRCIELLRPLGLVGVVLGLLWATPASAGNSSCQLGIKAGSAIADAGIDGQLGLEWADANELDSGSPCLDFLSNPSRPVKVYSKADATHLYMAFDVLDSTQNTTGGGQLKNGERILVQFDPNNSGGPTLGTGSGTASDYRIVVAHKWGAGPTAGTIQVLENSLFNSATTPANSVCGVQDWSQVATSPVKVGIAPRTGGYVVELKIPLASIGASSTAGTAMGVAFAVIDDVGNGTTDDAVAVAFPKSMPLTNGMYSPATLASWCVDWLVPNAWGTGYFGAPPGNVTLSHSPVYWNSQSIQALACGQADNTYYPAQPCRMEIQATLKNTTTSVQQRNLLYLWADHGSSPSTWRVIALKEGVSVPVGGTDAWVSGGPNTFSSGEWNGVPPGLANHPCVRVYILPAAFLATFPKSSILAISNAADLQTMEQAYGLTVSPNYSAQKNISRHDPSDANDPSHGRCPYGDACFVIGSAPVGMRFAALSLLSEAHAGELAPAGKSSANTRLAANTMSTAGSALATTVYGQTPPAKTGVLLSRSEMDRYAGKNVVVQVRSFGYAKRAAGPGQRYNFIEDLGGVLQVVPVEMLRKNQQIPIKLNVGNPGNVERTIYLRVDTLKPAGFEEVNVVLDTEPKTYGPGETRVVTGVVGKGAQPESCGCFNPSCWVKRIH